MTSDGPGAAVDGARGMTPGHRLFALSMKAKGYQLRWDQIRTTSRDEYEEIASAFLAGEGAADDGSCARCQGVGAVRCGVYGSAACLCPDCSEPDAGAADRCSECGGRGTTFNQGFGHEVECSSCEGEGAADRGGEGDPGSGGFVPPLAVGPRLNALEADLADLRARVDGLERGAVHEAYHRALADRTGAG